MRIRIINSVPARIFGLIAAVFLTGCADPAAPPSGEPNTPPPTNTAPSAVFSTNCTLLDCSFDATASTDSDGSIDAYDWDFGDGATDATISPSHNYSAEGNFTITLIVTDDGSATSTSSQAVSVVSTGTSNNPPSVSFSSNCTDLICNFDASASSDSDGTITSYAWDYGDFGTGTGQTSGHTYATSGVYTVMLTVTDNAGAASSSSQNLSVTGSGPPDGQALFTQKCSTCHGTDALGGTIAKISIVGRTALQITDAIASVVNMRSLNTLTAEEIQAIADYLATL